jgi:hypothetical protein
MEARFARAREQMLAYRNNCIQNMHHARLRCVEILPVAKAAVAKAALDSVIEEQRALLVINGSEQEQRAIRAAAAGPWREAESLIGRAAPGFGRDVYSNDLGPLSRTTALAIDVSAAAHASGRDAAAHASSRELIALQQELLGACTEATAAATSSSNPASAAGAMLRATATFAKFCEYIRRIAIGVLADDEDENAV